MRTPVFRILQYSPEFAMKTWYVLGLLSFDVTKIREIKEIEKNFFENYGLIRFSTMKTQYL